MLTLEQQIANWCILIAQDKTEGGNWWFSINDILNNFFGLDEIKPNYNLKIDIKKLEDAFYEHRCVDEVSICDFNTLKDNNDEFIDIFLYPDFCGVYEIEDDYDADKVYIFDDVEYTLSMDDIYHSTYDNGTASFGLTNVKMSRYSYDLFKQDPNYFRKY